MFDDISDCEVYMSDKNSLTAKQQVILDYIKEEVMKRGYAPSVREIGAAVGLSSTSSVHNQLQKLEQKGYIKKDPSKPRTIVVVDDEFNIQEREIVNIPVVGEVAAGLPIFADQNITGYFPMLAEEMPQGELFMLKIKGESMINAGIYDGDMVLIKKQNTASNGDIVVAILEDSATIKTYRKEKDYVVLQPENDTMDPIIVKNRELIIVGKLIGLYRSYM